ncbi:NAD(P)-dependent oxidoreductase [Paenarthrobacter sp. DKR-5]|uniref:NAD(P)-dependent oxidoreductase n=1 Tax=Paenarthrobacter sp. DKR-5 TaxID=2835535 RepID=UPI001BDC5B3F|nr:NAD(P)-dependent oxidoreductase [Paenarthrobacter sp. DKR-5]MBT1003941.1 NAD(P)-dependent oxidoreductase [Paenarthrobacter sp. DKR-5]
MTGPAHSSGNGVVAFIGLGRMGLPMSRCLLEAGWTVVGFDPSDTARQAFQDAGGTPAADAGGAVEGADYVILMLPNSRIVETVISEARDALKEGVTVIDMSSSEPLSTRKLAGSLKEEGVTLVDAPVSGGVIRAVNGTLTIMVGASAEDFDRVQPLLKAMGKPRRAGDVGAGHAAKAINNLMSATHLLISAEGVEAGKRFGLDPALLIDIINTSTGRSGSTETKYPKFILPESYDSGFALDLLLKDMRIAASLAKDLGTPTSLADASIAVWAQAAQDLPAGADHTEIARWVTHKVAE